MTDLSPDARALLRGARDDLGASKEDCARIDRALTARLGLAAGAIAGATAATSASAATASAAGVGLGGVGGTTALVAGKWIAGAVVVAAIGAGSGAVYLASGPSTSRPTPVAPLAPAASAHVAKAMPLAASSSATIDPPERTAPPPEPAAASTVRTERGRVQAAPTLPSAPEQSALVAPAMVAVTPTIGAETQLLRRADQALRNGDPARALDLLDEHARTFPNGVLAQERSAERVTTLCALGRVGEARTEAARFLAANTESPLADAVRRSCAGENAVGDPAPVP